MLISLLSDGEFHSGEELGKELSISRAAIWKRLEALKELGLSYESVRGRGYRLLPAIVPLCDKRINDKLRESTISPKVHIHGTLDSSNAELLRKKHELQAGDVIIAEMQTQGRGRRGREWFSPYAANINLSMYWKFEHGMKAADGLSLVVGLAVIQVLKSYAPQLQLKWPNDLVYDNKKLAGILLELVGEPNGVCHIAIGIGINVNVLDTKYFAKVDQAWVSLAQIIGSAIDRNELVPAIISSLHTYLMNFERHGFSYFKEEWANFDALKGQEALIYMGDQVIVGTADGVSDTGAFRLMTHLGLQTFTGGEVSLRKKI